MPKYVGTSVPRLRDPFLVAGMGKFTSDYSLPNMLYIAFLRSPHARARIKGINTDKAAKVAGVVRVITGKDAKEFTRPIPLLYDYTPAGGKDFSPYCLTDDMLHYAGEGVAAVVAENKFIANQAVELIEVDYDVLPAVVDPEKALEKDAPLVIPEWGDNVLIRTKASGGDTEKAFKEADFIIKDRIRSHRYKSTPIEPRCYVADYDAANASLTFYATTQQPHPLRTILSDVMKLDEPKVRVVQPDVGGGFGEKIPPYPEESVVALASVLTNRPVKWVEDRRENFLASGHAREQIHDFEVAFMKDGRIVGLRNHIIADVGVPSQTAGAGMAFVSAAHIPGVYKIPNCEIELTVAVTNKAPWNAYRGYGKENSNLVMERVMNLVAKKVGIDPAQVRLMHFVMPNEFPYKQITGQVLDSGNYPKVLKQAMELFEYDKMREERERLRKEGRLVGIGLVYELTPEGACFPNSFVTGYDGTIVRVGPSGKVTALTGITSPGSGNETMIAQVVADELGVPIGDVTVIQGDTQVCPYGLGNFSGRSTIVGAGSAMLAAKEIRAKMIRLAAQMLEARESDLTIEDGKIFVKGSPTTGMTFAKMARTIYRDAYDCPPGFEPGLESTRYYRTPIPYGGKDIGSYPSYANMAHLAFVEVDPDTFQLKILKYSVVDDSGVLVNPMIVEGQLQGALLQGIGGALYEELVYDESGQLLTTTFMDYPIPTAVESFEFQAGRVVTPSPFTPLGTKGVGESGIVGSPSVMIAAVEDALSDLGVKVDSLPLKPFKIWKFAQKAKARKAAGVGARGSAGGASGS